MKTAINLLAAASLISIFGTKAVHAQSIMPAADGTGTTVTSPSSNPNQFNIGGGSQTGANLFHSFQEFGLNSNQIANFLSTPNIQNILGRVVGGNPSLINGLIQVTGGNSNLYLMNPAGIIFGSNASFNLPASFTATTANRLQIGSDWFNATEPNNYANLVGNPSSFAFTTAQPGVIVNAGNLAVNPGESINLISGNTVNTGSLSAPGGQITVSSIPGKSLLRLNQPGNLLSLDIQPTALNDNFSALSLPELLTGNQHIRNATGLQATNGQVVLPSGTAIPAESGTTIISGNINVANSTPGKTGGTVQVLGTKVGLVDAATINASGDAGGGTILVGGDYQGKGSVPNAEFTFGSQDAVVQADALTTGNGGKVIFWADNTTRFYGNIFARGGSQSGDGGFVETSGAKTLAVDGVTVNTSAPNGHFGTWLLDPTDITVVAGGGLFLYPAVNGAGVNNTINASTIVTALNGTNVTLTAANSITVNSAIDSSVNASAGNLVLNALTTNLNAPITLFSGSTLSGTATTVNVASTGKIQNGIDVANPTNATVNVAAGTYTENLLIPSTKSNFTLAGPFAGVSAGGSSATSRGAEAIIVPAANNTTEGNIITVRANNVTIDGFKLDGDNTSLGGGRSLNGADVNAGRGISNGNDLPVNNFTVIQNLTVKNNIITNLNRFGVVLYSPAGTLMDGNIITNNRFDNMSSGNPNARAVYLLNNVYADVTNNYITRALIGVQIQPQSSTTLGTRTNISNNTIESYFFGIWHNPVTANNATYTIANNNLSASDYTSWSVPGDSFVNSIKTNPLASPNGNTGIMLSSVTGNTSVNLNNNNVSGSRSGIQAWRITTSGTAQITGGTLSNNQYGILFYNVDPNFGDAGAGQSTLNVNGVTVQNSTRTGVQTQYNSTLVNRQLTLNIQNSTLSNNTTGLAVIGGTVMANGATINIGSNNTITGGNVGLLIDGSGSALTGLTINNTSFSGQTSRFIALTNNALDNQRIDASAAKFNNVSGQNLTLAQYNIVQSGLNHELNDSTLGLICLNSSCAPPAAPVVVTPTTTTTTSLTLTADTLTRLEREWEKVECIYESGFSRSYDPNLRRGYECDRLWRWASPNRAIILLNQNESPVIKPEVRNRE